ncbi:MAG TPA: hypothetical protein VFQ44_20845 [Streptosporangiaceae bacterium]|nr:hypothetical protein [Streptosporangiaceae bacterium]
MSAASDESLALFARGVADQLRDSQRQRLEPPPGVPERSLIWLALAPVWTPRLAAACGFPDETRGEGRRTLQRDLEQRGAGLAGANSEAASAAEHAFAVLALAGGRHKLAARHFSKAAEGFRQQGDSAGLVAAEYQLSRIASIQGDIPRARSWLLRASEDEAGWADDVCAAVVARRLASLTAGEPGPVPYAAIVVLDRLAPATLDAARVLDRIARSGLCNVTLGDAPEAEAETETSDRPTEHRYWMTDLIRQQVIEQVIGDPSKGISFLQRELAAIGKGMLTAARDGVPILRSTVTWARLAELGESVTEMAGLLRKDCDRLLVHTRPGEVSPTGAALAWVEAAEPLEELLKGELTVALDRARRQLDLYHRRRDDDQRYLKHFLERPEQVRVIRELINDDDAWALHFAGPGGTGKTMLMRYISSVLGPRLGASTARIDFDYLSPDYPAERPGLLLAELAAELRLNAGGAAMSLFAHFDEQLVRLHEQRTGAESGAAAASALRSSIDEVLAAFGGALAALPRPVILLIDTCEELAKVRPDGSSPEGVTRTFAILSELRRTVPGLKVIFAGRRPLASEGDGWRTRGESDLPARPYLRLCEVLGFTSGEALAYLASERVPPHLCRAVLDQSRDRSDPELFTWTDLALAANRTDRYSPFELSGWAALTRQRDGEGLTAADISAADTDRYIELRIIRRIRYAPLKRALPAIGLLGRCDPAILRAALADFPDFEKMFAELRQQEWISRRGLEFYEVDESLRRRLLAHYERTSPAEVAQCCRRLAEYLERRTIEDPLRDLLPFHFDTAMRVLAREPGRAARWWARAEARLVADGQFDWGRQLCELMLGPEGACAEADPYGDRPPEVTALRAGVLATQLACLTHTRPGADRHQGWQEVAELLPAYPDAQVAERLGVRAAAGLVATAPPAQGPPPGIGALAASAAEALGQGDPQQAASVVAALETIVERAEQERALQEQAGPAAEPGAWLVAALSIDLDALAFLVTAHRGPRSDLECFSYSLTGRLAVLRREFETAARSFRLAVKRCRATSVPSLIWLDWRPPDDLLSRLELEFARGTYPAIHSAQTVLAFLWGTGSSRPPSTVDAERLASARLTLIAAVRPADPEEVLGFPVRASSGLSARLRPERNVHRVFPALTTAAAELMAAGGDVDGALDLLTTAMREWERSSREFDSVLDAERMRLQIIRRMRLRDEGQGLTSELTRSALLADRELLWALDGLDGAKAAGSGATGQGLEASSGEYVAAWSHARWRTRSPLAWSDDFWNSLGHGQTDLMTPGTFAQSSAFLDVVEISHLMRGAGRPPPPDSAAIFPSVTPLLLRWWQDHPGQPEQALRLLLRTSALRQPEPRRAAVPKDLIQRLGRRRAALIALDEGELLALRLPDRARPIVDLAVEWFGQCDDHGGALIARILAALVLARLGLRAFPDVSSATGTELRFFSYLPSIADFSDIAVSRDKHAMERLGPAGWRPWMVRLLAYETWAGYGPSRTAAVRWLQGWIERQYGQVRPDGVAVPAELDGWLHAAARDQRPALYFAEFFRELARAPRQLRRVRELRRSGQPYLGLALRLLSLTAFLVLIIASFSFVAFGAGLIGWLTWAGIVLVVVAVPGVRERKYKLRRGQPGAPTTPILGTVAITPGSKGVARLALTAAGLGDVATIPVPSLDEPYELVAPALQEGVTFDLSRLSQAGRRSDVLQLSLPAELAGVCWEAAFASPLRVIRTVPGRRARPVKSWRELASAVSVVADSNQADMVTRGWAGLIGRRRYRHRIWRPDMVYGEAVSGEETDVVHIVATPIETASGPRLELGRVTGDQYRIRSDSTPRGELMRAADVLARFPDLAFCVLQATPQEHLDRTETQRRQAATLRMLAAEIFSLGVPAVVTIPALPTSVTVSVLAALSAAVTSRPRRFAAALTDALRYEAERLETIPGLSPECALDLCLYAGQGPFTIVGGKRRRSDS